MMLDRILIMAQGMNERFPNGNKPYEITTRILEECGEVAKEVNHFENSGTKAMRHGEPSKVKLAGEIRDALNALMQLTIYYGVEEEVKQAIEEAIQNLTNEGYLSEGEVNE